MVLGRGGEGHGLEFTTPYERVLDDSGGIPWSKWFVGGHVNLTYNCVDRHALGDRADRVAIISEHRGRRGAHATPTPS